MVATGVLEAGPSMVRLPRVRLNPIVPHHRLVTMEKASETTLAGKGL